VKSKVRTWLLPFALLSVGAASAQSPSQDPLTDCPPLPQDAQPALRWETIRAPEMLFCRALVVDDNSEAFALTISPESPFRPRRSDRAEEMTVNGRQVQWFRGQLPNEPNVLIRETLLQLSEERVAHVFMRATNPEILASRQQLVLTLPLPVYVED